MDDQHIDGNGIADIVDAVAGAEMSLSCARASPAATAGRSASSARTGRSASCAAPACEDVGVVLGVQEKRLVVEWRGRYDIAR